MTRQLFLGFVIIESGVAFWLVRFERVGSERLSLGYFNSAFFSENYMRSIIRKESYWETALTVHLNLIFILDIKKNYFFILLTPKKNEQRD